MGVLSPQEVPWGRPDLPEEIKRKALEPDPSLKHRVELPGEVAAQLSQMRDDNRRLVTALHAEKQKVDRLASVTKAMYDVMIKTCGSACFSHPSTDLCIQSRPCRSAGAVPD